MAEYESSDKENMDEETALGHAAVKRARTMHAQRPLSHGRDNECRPVGLGLHFMYLCGVGRQALDIYPQTLLPSTHLSPQLCETEDSTQRPEDQGPSLRPNLPVEFWHTICVLETWI